MIRSISIVAATCASLLVVAPVASAQSGYFTATPTGKITKNSVITRNTMWKCGTGICSAAKAAERPAIMCELVVQRVGALSAFTANGAAFDADALAKCNARAR